MAAVRLMETVVQEEQAARRIFLQVLQTAEMEEQVLQDLVQVLQVIQDIFLLTRMRRVCNRLWLKQYLLH